MRVNKRAFFAVLAVVLLSAVTFAPIMSEDDSDGALPSYSYTINKSAKIISGTYVPIANTSSGFSGTYSSASGSYVGSWGFDVKGYGPFNSFYAAFDPANGNKMICHLNPNNLTKSIDGTSISGKGYNIMWCLPTAYWSTDSDGNLVLSNDPSKGTPYAHTIDGKVYDYLAIGVYEGAPGTLNGNTILTSKSGAEPLNGIDRATFRDYANNQIVNTDGGSEPNGYAMVWNFFQYELYKYCAVATMQSWDSQGVAGNGYSYANTNLGNYKRYTETPGALDTSGPYAGKKGAVTNYSYCNYPVKVFIENAWGGYEDLVDGVVYVKDKGMTLDQSSVPTDSTSKVTSGNIIYKGHLISSSGYAHYPTSTEGVWGMVNSMRDDGSGGMYDRVVAPSNTNPKALSVGNVSVQSSFDYCGINAVNVYSDLSSAGNKCGRLAFVFDDDPIGNPTITLDHSNLLQAGGDPSSLPNKMDVKDADTTYPDLGEVSGGFTHIGWYVDNVFYEKTAKVAKTTAHTAYSVWKMPPITITFYVEGEIYSTLEVPKGSVGVVYTPVMVEGIFAGWYYDASFTQKYDATRALNADTALYALGVPSLIFTTEPNANATITPLYGGMFFFDATESSGRYQIEWDFGDGNTSNDPIAYNTYSDPGLYTVTLTVTNIYGESSTTTYELDLRDGSAANDIKWFTIGALCVIVIGFVVRRLI